MATARLIKGSRSRPLYARNFIRIASEGFGDPQNIIAHAMAWFQGRLYVGTSQRERRQDKETKQRILNQRSFAHEPSQRGQIWMYNPQTDRWQKTFESPVVGLPDGSRAPRESGYRNMVVFQGTSDPAPALYVSSISNLGSLILCSEDGEHFVPASQPGLKNRDILAFRTLLPFNGRLYTSPTGRTSAEPPVNLEKSSSLETLQKPPSFWRILTQRLLPGGKSARSDSGIPRTVVSWK